ncbi:MAG: hypothetical protein MZW92_53615 [Comamonadaceae bacterium]|nr:hypothetical protein [Comamonadaceae bacterium]
MCVSFVVIDAFVGDRGLAALVRTRQEHDRLAAEVESLEAGERPAARAEPAAQRRGPRGHRGNRPARARADPARRAALHHPRRHRPEARK